MREDGWTDSRRQGGSGGERKERLGMEGDATSGMETQRGLKGKVEEEAGEVGSESKLQIMMMTV